MRYLKVFTVCLIMLASIPCFSQDNRETEARKLYLEASQLARAEEYKKAERILNQILKDYLDTEIALKADELLGTVSQKIKVGNLPKLPGFYVLLRNGEMKQINKLEVSRGAHNGQMVDYITAKQEELIQIYADELDCFYIYNPKADLSQVKWSFLSGVPTPEGQEPLNIWIIVDNWGIKIVGGELSFSDIVFKEIQRGLFEIRFPEKFSPISPQGAALTDATGYVGAVIIQPYMHLALFPLMEFWQPAQIIQCQAIVSPLLLKYPEKPELHLISGVLAYKQSFLARQTPVKAKEEALKGLKALSQTSEVPPNIQKHLTFLLNQCKIDSMTAANSFIKEDSKENASQKLKELDKIEILGSEHRNFRFFNNKALLYNQIGNYEKALLMCEKSLGGFKMFGEKGSFLGGLVKVDIQLGAQTEDQNTIHFQKYVNAYTKDNKKLTENIKDYVESEQILARVQLDFIDGSGDPKEGLELVKEARGKDKHNEHVYLLQIQLAEKIGDQKGIEKAKKDLEEAKAKNFKENRGY